MVLPETHYTRSTSTVTTPTTECVDVSPDCDTYPRDSCSDYEPYARRNCARTCGYCPGEYTQLCYYHMAQKSPYKTILTTILFFDVISNIIQQYY